MVGENCIRTRDKWAASVASRVRKRVLCTVAKRIEALVGSFITAFSEAVAAIEPRQQQQQQLW